MTDTIAETSPEAEYDLAKSSPVASVIDPMEELLADLDMSGLPTEDEEVMAALDAADMDDDPTGQFTDPSVDESPTDQPTFTETSVVSVCTDRLVKAKRSISPYRDAKFMRQLSELYADGEADTEDTTLLVKKPLSSTSTPTSISTSVSLTAKTDPNAVSSYFLESSKRFPWWCSANRPVLPSPARQYRNAAPWRDTSEYLKATFRHIALKSFGEVYAFTLNLAPDIEAQARANANPIGWLHRRISHHLKTALDRGVQFHFIAEEAAGHRLHLHGEIQISASEAKEARRALRKAGGAWVAGGSNKQVTTAPNPDSGWVDYTLGDLWKVGFTRKIASVKSPVATGSSVVMFDGAAVSTTDELNSRAADIYAAERHRVGTY